MQIHADTPEKYLEQVPAERKEAMNRLRATILENIPAGFVEVMNYGMIGYVVPHSTYPKGYHCNPEMPLPFMNIASQKNHISLYHMGMYGNKQLLEWFTGAYHEAYKTKPDMGKGCIRFKNMEKIPYPLIGELVKKVSVADWILIYEENLGGNRAG